MTKSWKSDLVVNTLKNRLRPKGWSNAMKRYLYDYAAILVCLLLVGAVKSDGYVKENVFHSSSPKLQVKVDPRFKYLGKLDHTLEQQSPDRLQMVSYETKSFIFVEDVGQQLKKAAYIQIRREQTKYVGNFLGDAKANIRSGICSLGQKEYKCFTRAILLSGAEPIAKFISEHGYNLPACVLARTFTRVDFSAGNYLIVLTYLENLPESGPDCSSWQAEQPLTMEQKRFLEQFDRNREASFKVVEEGYKRPGMKGLMEGESIFEKTDPYQ